MLNKSSPCDCEKSNKEKIIIDENDDGETKLVLPLLRMRSMTKKEKTFVMIAGKDHLIALGDHDTAINVSSAHLSRSSSTPSCAGATTRMLYTCS